MTETLTDNSPMPYGKYKGVEMQEVPASYLIWLYENDKCSDSVKEYVEDNLEILKSEINN